MGRKRGLTRNRAGSILLAALAGYMIGSWHAAAVRDHDDLPAAQAVALRFPQKWTEASPVPAVTAAVTAPAANSIVREAQLVLWSPEPMVDRGTAVSAAASAPAAGAAAMIAPEYGAPAHTASAEITQPVPVSYEAPPTQSFAESVASVHETKRPTPPAHKHAERPGFVLNDAQIASIKERLHLTPYQEQMWPAVEAALRNLAYTRSHDARRHGETAAVAADPNSAEVQNLKSAAIPLLMSFNSDQKDEVRNLAHVMGLDQLAKEF